MKFHYISVILSIFISLSLPACVPPPPAAAPTTLQQDHQQTSSPTILPTTLNITESTLEPTVTPIPPPIECKHPSVTKNVFLQLDSVGGQFPFYGPVGDVNFLCQGVYNNSHTGSVSIRLEYKNVGTNVGWWGIAMPNGYDVTEFSRICFWAYAQNPNQAFRLKLKDMNEIEKGITLNVDQGGVWTQICTDLSKFAEQGVLLEKLENINIGFEEPTGSAAIWVDDFELR